MEYEEYVRLGLDDSAPLKVILCGNVQQDADGKKVGVVSVVYATMDKAAAERKLNELTKADSDSYYMVYGVALDTDLTTLVHYPSIAISESDFQ